jgi:glycosyltransferase involved in cell wall biosynthesis
MNLRTPVVATRHGGNPEAIVDGVSGFLVDPHRPEAFLPPIERLVSNPEERLSITEEAARFAAGLSTEAHVARVTAIYEELMEQRLYGKNASNRQARPGHASTAERRPGAR